MTSRYEGSPREDALREAADDAYEAVRGINHATVGWQYEGIPAPEVYTALGALRSAVYGLEQALGQLATGLEKSLDTYEVREDDSADPAPRAQESALLMRAAGQQAYQMGELLSRAQSAIATQAHNGRRAAGDG